MWLSLGAQSCSLLLLLCCCHTKKKTVSFCVPVGVLQFFGIETKKNSLEATLVKLAAPSSNCLVSVSVYTFTRRLSFQIESECVRYKNVEIARHVLQFRLFFLRPKLKENEEKAIETKWKKKKKNKPNRIFYVYFLKQFGYSPYVFLFIFVPYSLYIPLMCVACNTYKWVADIWALLNIRIE